MKKLKTISLIIPTYYRYKYLDKIFNLINKQSVIPDEIIVVDQTPESDRPSNFYKNHCKANPNISIFYLQNPSAPNARNFGAKKSTSEVLLIIDDDIIFNKDFVESHLKVMNEQSVDVVNGAVSSKEFLKNEYPWDIRTMDPVRFFLGSPNYKWEGMMCSITSGNFSIRRDVYIKSGGFDLFAPRMQDYEFGFRLFRKGAKIFYSYKPLAQHLRGEGGLRKNSMKFDRLVGAIYLHKKHFPGWITKQFFLKSILRLHSITRPWSIIKLIIANHQANKLFNNYLKKR